MSLIVFTLSAMAICAVVFLIASKQEELGLQSPEKWEMARGNRSLAKKVFKKYRG
jgi:hypothetical protein